jgi:hypothetical protein
MLEEQNGKLGERLTLLGAFVQALAKERKGGEQ